MAEQANKFANPYKTVGSHGHVELPLFLRFSFSRNGCWLRVNSLEPTILQACIDRIFNENLSLSLSLSLSLTHTHTHTHTYHNTLAPARTHTHTHKHTHTNTHIPQHARARTHTQTHTHKHAHTTTRSRTHTHTHTYTHTHAHTHTHSHTHTYKHTNRERVFEHTRYQREGGGWRGWRGRGGGAVSVMIYWYISHQRRHLRKKRLRGFRINMFNIYQATQRWGEGVGTLFL